MESVSIHRSSRSLDTARIWSVTATTSRPPHRTGTKRGGLNCGELESGTTTTVRRRWLSTSLESIKQGLVLAISDPSVESSRTHQISPRLANILPLLNPSVLAHPLPLDGENIRVLVGNFAGLNHPFFAFTEFRHARIGDVPGSVTRGNAPQELCGYILRNGERNLPTCHITILHIAICSDGKRSFGQVGSPWP